MFNPEDAREVPRHEARLRQRGDGLAFVSELVEEEHGVFGGHLLVGAVIGAIPGPRVRGDVQVRGSDVSDDLLSEVGQEHVHHFYRTTGVNILYTFVWLRLFFFLYWWLSWFG